MLSTTEYVPCLTPVAWSRRARSRLEDISISLAMEDDDSIAKRICHVYLVCLTRPAMSIKVRVNHRRDHHHHHLTLIVDGTDTLSRRNTSRAFIGMFFKLTNGPSDDRRLPVFPSSTLHFFPVRLPVSGMFFHFSRWRSHARATSEKLQE
jgi:hypothetical protein